MTTITIQITIDAGPEARVSVGMPAQNGHEHPFEDELVPLPEEPTAFRGAAHGNIDQCPVHHEPWKLVPAGISKSSGKPYDAFRACPVRGCTQRPAKAAV